EVNQNGVIWTDGYRNFIDRTHYKRECKRYEQPFGTAREFAFRIQQRHAVEQKQRPGKQLERNEEDFYQVFFADSPDVLKIILKIVKRKRQDESRKQQRAGSSVFFGHRNDQPENKALDNPGEHDAVVDIEVHGFHT